jgi:N-sulfoglucosamine sulfohydrolase
MNDEIQGSLNTTPPNILMITCHDLGRFLGCYGVATVHTPHLDRLASIGVRFEQAFCTAPQCSPSRASLFTGRYPHCNGVMGLTHGDFAWDLHRQEQHLGQVLQSAGYATVVIGVHHESRAGDRQRIAERCGMDEVVPPGDGEYVSDEALARLARYAEEQRPFYMHLGYHEPHRAPGPGTPDYMGFVGDYITPDDELGVTIPPYLRDEPEARQELAELQGAVRYVDSAIGKVLNGLQALGLEQTALVVLTTDHGLALPRAKCSLYDPGLETALIMRLPARKWSGGRVISGLVSNVDVFPTVLDAVGISVNDGIHGRSLCSLVDGDAVNGRGCIFAEMTYHDYYDPRRCVRTENHKLIVNFSAAPSFMDPSQSWRPRTIPVVPANPAAAYHPVVELYDLDADPLERDNKAGESSLERVRHDLLARLGEWMRATDDPLLHGAVTSPTHRAALGALMNAERDDA